MGRVFVLGDIHGAFRALQQCLKRSAFDYDNDQMIALGDVCDGWPETRQCVDELLKLKKLTYLLGNHDLWFREWIKDGIIEPVWFDQGGKATIQSYGTAKVPSSHLQFLERGLPYYINNNKLFVHAGINITVPIEQQGEDIFLWDRGLARAALSAYHDGRTEAITSYEEVYIGHTPIGNSQPISGGGVWLMDTGAGWQGVLSMMDINSKEVFTSDPVPGLYPGVQGRSRG